MEEEFRIVWYAVVALVFGGEGHPLLDFFPGHAALDDGGVAAHGHAFLFHHLFNPCALFGRHFGQSVFRHARHAVRWVSHGHFPQTFLHIEHGEFMAANNASGKRTIKQEINFVRMKWPPVSSVYSPSDSITYGEAERKQCHCTIWYGRGPLAAAEEIMLETGRDPLFYT